jgi:hypothetical protein
MGDVLGGSGNAATTAPLEIININPRIAFNVSGTGAQIGVSGGTLRTWDFSGSGAFAPFAAGNITANGQVSASFVSASSMSSGNYTGSQVNVSTINGNTVSAGTVTAFGELVTNGGLRFTSANPYITAPNPISLTGGLTVNSGVVTFNTTTIFGTTAIARGGIRNDSAANLMIFGGTSNNTQFSGSIGVGLSPSENVHAAGNIRADGTVMWGNGLMRTEVRNDAGSVGRSGFYETQAPANFYPSANNWQHLIEARHSNSGANYALQIAGSFFDQDLWYRKTNGSGVTNWMQIIGAGARPCTAPFTSMGATLGTSMGGVNRSNTICATPRFGANTFNEAQNVCYALGGHVATYNELYRLSQLNGINNVVAIGDWIGDRVGDDTVACVNSTDLLNFEGVCNKAEGRPYRCVNSSTFSP